MLHMVFTVFINCGNKVKSDDNLAVLFRRELMVKKKKL
jgi:hypothetical protein